MTNSVPPTFIGRDALTLRLQRGAFYGVFDRAFDEPFYGAFYGAFEEKRGLRREGGLLQTQQRLDSVSVLGEGHTPKGVRLRVVDFHTGNHRENDFTPPETFREAMLYDHVEETLMYYVNRNYALLLQSLHAVVKAATKLDGCYEDCRIGDRLLQMLHDVVKAAKRLAKAATKVPHTTPLIVQKEAHTRLRWSCLTNSVPPTFIGRDALTLRLRGWAFYEAFDGAFDKAFYRVFYEAFEEKGGIRGEGVFSELNRGRRRMLHPIGKYIITLYTNGLDSTHFVECSIVIARNFRFPGLLVGGPEEHLRCCQAKGLKVEEKLVHLMMVVKFKVLIEKKKMCSLGLMRFDLWIEFLMVHIEELEMKKLL
uniref:Uncharacterized protein n=1 Tax=Tanacetum cinerariifolium TaxID=118510 RepID=A0A6L2MIN9_TANCI|nr:hypothetical protein [Tanacetum cinerariifolium]